MMPALMISDAAGFINLNALRNAIAAVKAASCFDSSF